MLQSPFTPFRNAFIRDLKEITDEELLDLFYTGLRWMNYFQDEDDLFIYVKIAQDVHMEVKRRGLKYKWTKKDIKKYRILAQKMYYGSMPVKELEWRLGVIIMHAIPVCRSIVRRKLYLVRERIHIIIEAIHHQHYWSALEYNKDLLDILDVPFFSYDNFSDIYNVLKAMFYLSENVIIFVLIILRQAAFVWSIIDPDCSCLRNILMITNVFAIGYLISYYTRDDLRLIN